jgi:diacylglycerol kinase
MDIKKLIRSFGYALDGLKLALGLDQNVRFHLIVGTLVFVAAVILQSSKLELMFVIFAIFFVIICEMVNTAIEEMTNLIKIEHSREARIAKDVAAGAVLLSAIFAFIVGVMVLVPRLIALF